MVSQTYPSLTDPSGNINNVFNIQDGGQKSEELMEFEEEMPTNDNTYDSKRAVSLRYDAILAEFTDETTSE